MSRKIYKIKRFSYYSQQKEYGIDILKKHGATKEEIKNAKELLNTAGKTYKEGAKSDLKKNLSNFIKPKHE